MTQASPLRWANHRRGRPWPRQRARQWTRTDGIPSAAALFAAIPSLPRAVLARLTERMIDRMDEIDGDPDDEDGTHEQRENSHD